MGRRVWAALGAGLALCLCWPDCFAVSRVEAPRIRPVHGTPAAPPRAAGATLSTLAGTGTVLLALGAASRLSVSARADSVKLFSPAKVNLFLRIIRRRPDGYHDLASLFQTVAFGDTLEIEALPEGAEKDELECNLPGVPVDDSNLVIRALKLFRKKSGFRTFFRVNLEKEIPAQAGMGGGSSNAATAFFGANLLCGMKASPEDSEMLTNEFRPRASHHVCILPRGTAEESGVCSHAGWFSCSAGGTRTSGFCTGGSAVETSPVQTKGYKRLGAKTPEPVEFQEALQAAAALTDDQRQLILELATDVEGGNTGRVAYSKNPTEHCKVCGGQRHQVKWGEVRSAERTQASIPRGSLCYCCVRAAKDFGLRCRSYTVYRKAGALSVWRARSLLERRKLSNYSGDTCNCGTCLG
ncbi:unnamed protein product [Effrenium voratum]|nr:unnamed protein product [Effrenium voratum]